LDRQGKREDRVLGDPGYEETAAAEATLGPHFNRLGKSANRRGAPGQFLGELRRMEIQAIALGKAREGRI
jgi:hypothetical protein